MSSTDYIFGKIAEKGRTVNDLDLDICCQGYVPEQPPTSFNRYLLVIYLKVINKKMKCDANSRPLTARLIA